MSEKWMGIIPGAANIKGAVVSFDNDALQILQTPDWKVGLESRETAYYRIFQNMCGVIRDNNITNVVIRASVTFGTLTMVKLQTAEVRGVLMAAVAATGITCRMQLKSELSNKIGERNTDEYLDDDAFWKAKLGNQKTTKSSRDAIAMILCVRDA